MIMGEWVHCTKMHQSDFWGHILSGMILSAYYLIWSNYSDLTRVLGPQKVAFWKGNPRLFQRNLAWRNIIIWPDLMCGMYVWDSIWAIYNDLSRGHPKWWFSKGIPPKMALN